MAARPAFQHVLPFPPEAEYLVRVPVDDLTHLRQPQTPASLRKELFSERLFQLPQLSADRGLREPQLLTCAGDTALARHCPEVQQAMVVQPLHAGTLHRLKR